MTIRYGTVCHLAPPPLLPPALNLGLAVPGALGQLAPTVPNPTPALALMPIVVELQRPNQP